MKYKTIWKSELIKITEVWDEKDVEVVGKIENVKGESE